MKYLQLLAAIVGVAPFVLSAPLPDSEGRALDVNPYALYTPYANKGYARKLEQTIQTFLDAGDTLNADRTRTVQKAATFIWVAETTGIPSIRTLISEALEAQQATGKKQIAQIVVYNLPDRDCGAKASAGEFDLADDGLNKYKRFIDTVVAELSTPDADELQFTIVLEPDSLGNAITSLDVPKCANAVSAYKEGISYAIAKLQRQNIAIYLDAAHGGWLGWNQNLEPAAKIFAEVVKGAQAVVPGATVRGLSTNVSNYNKYIAEVRDPITQWNDSWDEFHYVNNLAPYLKAAGFPAHFIIDQGRSGVIGIRATWANWCNIRGAGYGIRPTADQAVIQNEYVDAIVWVKPGGESDGTSDPGSPRYDLNCVGENAHTPAPEAGQWHNDYVVNLVKNANPPLEPTRA